MRRIYRKDILQAFSKSKGRLFSIFSLMAIGAMALIGLKVTTPNMQRTAQQFINETKLMDLAVMSDYGLSKEDVAELSEIGGATVEFSYLTDVTISGKQDAVRIFSISEQVSKARLLSGEMPTASNQIVLSENLKASYRIGDRISFVQNEKGILKTTDFTVTGFASSAEIWDNDSMGQSSAGTGELSAYAFALDKAFDSPVYMIARIFYHDLENKAYYQKDYDKLLDQHQSDLESLLQDNGSERLKVIKTDGQRAIDKGYQDIADSEKPLADAAKAISDGEKALADGQHQLVLANQQLIEGQSQLLANQEELSLARQQLEASAEQLTVAKSQLDAAKAELDGKRIELEAANQALNEARAGLDSAQADLTQKGQELSEGWLQLEEAKSDLHLQREALLAAGQELENFPDLIATQSLLTAKESELNEAQKHYELGLQTYQVGQETYLSHLAAYESGLAQYTSGQSLYDQNLAQYESGQASYQAGMEQYQSGLSQYQSALSRLATWQAALAVNQETFTQEQQRLEQAKQDYTNQKTQAETEIAKAKEDLSKAQKDLDKLTVPNYTSYTRATLPGSEGYNTYTTGAQSVSAVGDIFPVVLYLVAALVTLTTMTRYVDEERTNAGIFKALGYSNHHIIAKFVIYGLVASLLGTVVGILAGNSVLSPIIGNILTEGTVIGAAHSYFYPEWLWLAIGLAVVSAVLPAYMVAKRELTQEAAYLLQAKPPVAGSKIFLERVPFIWRRLGFTQKVTARNIFRYKQRMLMTIFGVAGSVALLFTGLGIQSSISGVADTQFGDIIRYDMIVVGEELEAQLLTSADIKDSLAVTYQLLTEQVADKDVSINLLISNSPLFMDYLSLRDPATGTPLLLDNSGAIISEKLAQLYGIRTGDQVELELDNRVVSITVSSLAEMYAGHYLYMTADYYEELLGKSASQNAYLVKLNSDSDDQVKTLAANLLSRDKVTAVVQNTALANTIHTVANSLQSVMVILIVLSILLALVILYNLTNINVAERIRELSTIKVLGFHNNEVTMYIYRETISLSLIGIVTGLVGGRLLHRLILGMIGSSQIMFKPSVDLYVYLVPIFAITGILALLGIYVSRTLRKVDMLEALKSVE